MVQFSASVYYDYLRRKKCKCLSKLLTLGNLFFKAFTSNLSWPSDTQKSVEVTGFSCVFIHQVVVDLAALKVARYLKTASEMQKLRNAQDWVTWALWRQQANYVSLVVVRGWLGVEGLVAIRIMEATTLKNLKANCCVISYMVTRWS